MRVSCHGAQALATVFVLMSVKRCVKEVSSALAQYCLLMRTLLLASVRPFKTRVESISVAVYAPDPSMFAAGGQLLVQAACGLGQKVEP
jgi:hypothetical protein